MLSATHDFTSLLSRRSQYHYQASMLFERYAQTGERKFYSKYQRIKEKEKNLEKIISEITDDESKPKRVFELINTRKLQVNEVSKLIFIFQQFAHHQKVENIQRLWHNSRKLETLLSQSVKIIYDEWQSDQAEKPLINAELTSFRAANIRWSKKNIGLIQGVKDASLSLKHISLWISVTLGILLVLIGVVVTVRAKKTISQWELMLNEKQVMLSEIHHRVKNNLAVISGLLMLESERANPPKKVLQESQDRIKSMSMIHEILYKSDSLSEINMAKYIQRLINYIGDMYLGKHTDLKIELDLERVDMTINQAVPLGLLINELLTNAIEHGFRKNENGKINVNMKEMDREVYVSIQDNGIGLPTNFDLEAAETTGLTIVKALVNQLDADLNVSVKSGVKFELSFQKKSPDSFTAYG